MGNNSEPNPRKYRGGRNGNRIRIGTNDLTDWLREHLRNLSAKDISDQSGCSIRTAEDAKQGRTNLNPAHFATLKMNNPKIAAAYCEFIGVILPGQAEYAEAVTNFANAIARRGAP